MGDARPPSLFAVLGFGFPSPYFCNIVLLEKEAQGGTNMKKSADLTPTTCYLDVEKDSVARLTRSSACPVEENRWVFSASADGELCVVPDSLDAPYCDPDPVGTQARGCIWNLRTKRCKSFKPPGGLSYYECVASVGGHFYFLTHRHGEYESMFKRYDPVKGLCETLEPLKYYEVEYGNFRGISVRAIAVWEDTLLLKGNGNFLAYNVGRNKWYPVSVVDKECCNIVGISVVIENTIYALVEKERSLVLAISIGKKEINGDLEFSCTLLSKIVVPGMQVTYILDMDSVARTRRFVHLGGDNFCLVLSAQSFYSLHYQPIQVTYLKLEKDKGEKGENLTMTVTDIVIYQFKCGKDHQFRVIISFSLPDDKAAAIKQGKSSIFTFNPYPKVSEQQDKIRVPQVSPAPGHYIYVRNLASNVNANIVAHKLKKFGCIKKDGIQVLKKKKGKGKYAIVEFGSAESKKRAIEGSPIKIEGSLVEILDR